MITKKATDLNKFKRNWTSTDSARTAWSEIIEVYKKKNPFGKILLPAYIGWSKNEGSGIFDSVIKSKCDFDFYGLDSNLQIDLDELKQKLSQNKSQLVLIVHYFGFVDVNYMQISKWLIENNVFFVEDCAHAWLTDLIGSKCGKKGKYAFYSLHKLLPNIDGGMLVQNNFENSENRNVNNPYVELNFDLSSIYFARRSNYKYLSKLLKDVEGIEIIHKKLKKGICPQTLPVIIKEYDRTTLYNLMNSQGYGVVSLYHTMIRELENSKYDSTEILSKKILNFPIHQDVNKEDLLDMVNALKKILNV